MQKKLNIGLSPSRKVGFICLNESPLKMRNNVFYFTLKVTSATKVFFFQKVALDLQLMNFLFEEKTMFRSRDI